MNDITRTSKELCEHDWVGDDFCAYCDADAARDMLTDARLELDELRQALGVDYEPHQSLRERMLDSANHKRIERGVQGPCPNCGAKWASVELSSTHEPRAQLVKAHEHTCANVQPGSTYDDICDCGAVVDGAAQPPSPELERLARMDRLVAAGGNIYQMHAQLVRLVNDAHSGTTKESE